MMTLYSSSKLPIEISLPLIFFADYGAMVSDFHTVVVKVIVLSILFMYFDIDILWFKSMMLYDLIRVVDEE